jgi:cytochrome d ubiquinol oxidase subunit II
MHGAIYLLLKTEGDTQQMVKGWINNTIIFFLVCYATTTMATLIYRPEMTAAIKAQPLLFALPLLTMLAIANVPRAIHHLRYGEAFLSSSCAVLGLFGLVGVGMFPALVHAWEPARQLTIYNAASSPKTLGIMLIMAAIGIPLVLTYTLSIYWIFRGKVKLESTSY